MEDILLTCQIINKQEGTSDTVQIGSTVELYDEEFDEELKYKILGSTESDPSKGVISNISPVGSALLGKKKGDTIKVKTEGGEIAYKILSIN